MTLQGRQVAIVGAGVAGLAAADALARRGAAVTVMEKAPAAGGHAARFSCKATDRCVTCGACVAADQLRRTGARSDIALLTGTRIESIERTKGFTIAVARRGQTTTMRADALLVTSGFAPYDPSEKPYGYGVFPNVLTNLDAERVLRENGMMLRPSDGRPPERMAFIQCVGSRDARIGHPWCSKICCGSALRMAGLIQHRQPRVVVTFFYIDVQTFGRNFEHYYGETRKRLEIVRAIPGDIFKADDDRLRLTFYDPHTRKPAESIYDAVVLSVGLTPAPDNRALARMLGWPLADTGFFRPHDNGTAGPAAGIFTAGAALGPMSIAETIDSAGRAAGDIARYLSGLDRE